MSFILLGIAWLYDLFMTIIGVQKKRYTSPYTVFSLLWTVILSIYLFVDNKWIVIDTFAAFIIFLGDFVLVTTMYLVCHSATSHAESKQNPDDIERVIGMDIDEKCAIILSIITILLFSYDIPQRVSFLISGMSFNEINRYFLGNTSDGGLYLVIMRNLIARPYAYCSIYIFISELLREGKKRKILFFLQIPVQAFILLQSGKRSMLIYAVLLLLVEGINQNKFSSSIKVIRRRKSLLFILSLLALYALVWVSNLRDSNVISSISVYFAGCIPSFGVRYKELSNFYFGGGLLHGLLVPVMLMLHGFFKVPYPQWYTSLDSLVEAADYVSIGSNSSINAFNTVFYIPYIDLGIMGVILEMIFLGIIYGSVYRKLRYRNTYRNRMLNGLMLVGIFGSMYTMYFSQYPYALSFFYALFLTRKRTYVKNSCLYNKC